MGSQYYDDVAVCLRGIILAALAPAYAARNSRQVQLPLPTTPWAPSNHHVALQLVQHRQGSGRQSFLLPCPAVLLDFSGSAALLECPLSPAVSQSVESASRAASTALFLWPGYAFYHMPLAAVPMFMLGSATCPFPLQAVCTVCPCFDQALRRWLCLACMCCTGCMLL